MMRRAFKPLSILLMIGLKIVRAFAQEGWWMKEPIRWVQTDLRRPVFQHGRNA
jgi:hypothetical protein